mgnify:CR=1 FL=1
MGVPGPARSHPAHARPPHPDPDPTRRLAAIAVVLAWLLPAAATEGGPVLCPVRRVTGLPCPACGLTRSWAAALHGRPAASLRFHPLGMVLLAGAVAYAARLDERGRAPAVLADPRVRAGLAGGWLAVWVARLVAESHRSA